MIELSDWLWYQIPHDDNNPIPSSRQSHSGIIYRDEWVIFGGFAEDGPLDDMWTFSLVTKKWKQIKKYSFRSWPSATHSHTASFRSTTSKNGRSAESMIVFGGVTENGSVLNDTWEFSFRKSSWNKLDTTGDNPTPRWGHSAVIYQDHLWIFGGFSDKWNNELYCLDLVTLKWRKVNSEAAPQGRHGHSASLYNNKMYIFGGLSWKNFDDIASFDFATQSWEIIATTNSISGRRGHQAVVIDHYLIIHGGKDNSEAVKETCCFDFHTNTWSYVKEDPLAPSARFSHVACYWQNTIFVFGGFGLSNRATDKNLKPFK